MMPILFHFTETFNLASSYKMILSTGAESGSILMVYMEKSIIKGIYVHVVILLLFLIVFFFQHAAWWLTWRYGVK